MKPIDEETQLPKTQQLTSILRGLHLDSGWLELKLDSDKLERIEGIGDLLDDVVGPLVNRRVVVTAIPKTKADESGYIYQDIEFR